jgi:hypothetical protein
MRVGQTPYMNDKAVSKLLSERILIELPFPKNKIIMKNQTAPHTVDMYVCAEKNHCAKKRGKKQWIINQPITTKNVKKKGESGRRPRISFFSSRQFLLFP